MSVQSGEASRTWQRLGSGVHSVVWRIRKPRDTSRSISSQNGEITGMQLDPLDDLRNWVAVKVVYDNRSMPPHDIVHEATILRGISNRNIISILEFVRGGPDAPYALYMPLIPLPLTVLLSSPRFTPHTLTGPYSALARPVLLSPQRPGHDPFLVVTKSLIYQLLLSISYLHFLDPPISHRDINPGNVLIDNDGTLKLIDFGIAWAERQPRGASPSKTNPTEGSSSSYLSKAWIETPDQMCCQVATGPHRAPELLFSPPSYSAVAIDLWSLGTTIAQFFTPLQLNPSGTPPSSPSSTTSDDIDEIDSSPFVMSANLRKKIDYRATWERRTLFNGERGELGLAWSIFRLRGTPNKGTWPSFSSLPDVSKIEFREANRRPLHTALPHLPISPLHTQPLPEASPASLIDTLLAYPPETRLTAAQALQHPWFSTGLLLPSSHPGPDSTAHEKQISWTTLWEGRPLADWLEPALKRETDRVTRTGP